MRHLSRALLASAACILVAWPALAAPASESTQPSVGVRIGFPFLVGVSGRLPIGGNLHVAATAEAWPIGKAMIGRLNAQALFQGGSEWRPFFGIGPSYVFGALSGESIATSGAVAGAVSVGLEFRPSGGGMGFYAETGIDMAFSEDGVLPLPHATTGVQLYF